MTDGRIPADFRYWENRSRLWARVLRRTMHTALGFDPEPDDAVVRTLASMYFDADPVAEHFVDDVYLERGKDIGRAMLEQAIAGGVGAVPDAPQSLRDLFEDVDRDPEWLDRDQVELGARTFRRYGVALFHFAGAITLSAYRESSVAKPLVLTGAYSGANTRHRFLETAAFWVAVSEPGGLEPGAPGRASALRVRIMHVFVRRRLLQHPEWDTAAWGVPISQADALLTLMGGSFAPGIAMRAMGFWPSDAEILAMMHFWRYVGHIMGVRPRWYPRTMQDGYRLAYVTAVKAAHGAGRDGRELSRSYVQAFAPDRNTALPARLRGALEHGLHRGYTRFFLPPWIYRDLGLPPAGLWALHPLVQSPIIASGELLRRRFAAVDTLMDRWARRGRDRWLAMHMGARQAQYDPVPAFTR